MSYTPEAENNQPAETTPAPALYTPEYLNRWTLPRYYVGAEWPEYYVFLGHHRDSDLLTESNWETGLEAIGGEQTVEGQDGEDLETVLVVREGHPMVGWVEWIAIHESAGDALRIADRLAGKLEDYPSLNDDLLSEKEEDEAARLWKDCYSTREKVEMAAKERDYLRLDTPVWMFGRWDYGQLCDAGGKDYPHPVYRIAERLRDHLRENAR